MKIGDRIGTPPITPVAEVGDRKPRVQWRTAVTPREKEKAPPRDEFLATGKTALPAEPLVYDRSAWTRKVSDKGDGGQER